MTERGYIHAEFNRSPRVIVVESPHDELTMQDLVDTLKGIIEQSWNGIDEPALHSSAGKEDLGGETTVGITVTLQNTQIAFEARNTSISDGAATSNNSAGTLLTDTGADFVYENVVVGDTVINFSDMSLATVVEVVSATQLRHYKLDDGSGNDWEIDDYYKVFHVAQCNVSGGNLTAVDSGGNPIDSISPTAFTQIVRTSSASATLQELLDIQYSSFGGGVTVDTTSPYTGTAYPTGTPRQPVKTLTDAMSIATIRGFTTLFIVGDATIDSSGDYSRMIFIGESQTKTTMTVDTLANVTNAEFYDAHVTGTLDGNAKLKGCLITDLNYVHGVVESCILGLGTIVLGGSDTAHFLDCWSGVVGAGTPTIDLGGSGQELSLRNYNGGIKLKNKSGSEKVSIDLNSGQVVLEDSIENGEIIIRGIGKLTDNSKAGATVDATHLLGKESIEGYIWDGLTADHTATGSFGEALSFIKSVEGGKWKIENNQMLMYKEDNQTLVAKFNLFDSSGQPASTDVYERRRV